MPSWMVITSTKKAANLSPTPARELWERTASRSPPRAETGAAAAGGKPTGTTTGESG